jgi:hypothetical protein
MTASTSIAFYGETPFKSFLLAPADWCDSDPNVTLPADNHGGWQFRAYGADTSTADTAVEIGNVTGAKAFGILLNDPRQGEAGQFLILGETKVQYGATPPSAPWTPLMAGPYGTLIPWTSGSGYYVVGWSRYAQNAWDIGTAFVNFLPGLAAVT